MVVSAIASTPQTEFSWFRYGQYNETGIYISIEKTIIITITVSGGCFKKEYSIVSHMLVTDTITEATLYENGLYTRHIRLSRPVSDSKYPLPPGSQLIKNMTLRLRLQDQQEETSVTLFQGKSKRLVRTVLIFTESSDQLSRATDRVPGLPASPGYVQ